MWSDHASEEDSQAQKPLPSLIRCQPEPKPYFVDRCLQHPWFIALTYREMQTNQRLSNLDRRHYQLLTHAAGVVLSTSLLSPAHPCPGRTAGWNSRSVLCFVSIPKEERSPFHAA